MYRFLKLKASVTCKIQLNLLRTIIGEFLKGNKIAPIKIHNGGNYAHAQDFELLLELTFS